MPALTGCFFAGDSIENALESAKETIELHLEGLLEETEPLIRRINTYAYQKQLTRSNVLIEVAQKII